MIVVFIADCLTTQSAGIHVYAKQFIARVIQHYPQHNYYHITTESYDIPNSVNQVIQIGEGIMGNYRLRYFSRIPNLIKSLGAHVAIEMAHFGPFRLPKNIKRITVVHDLTPILYPKYHDQASVWWHKLFFRRLLRSVDGIVCNSFVTRTDLVNHIKIQPQKISVCYPKIDIHNIESVNYNRDESGLTLLTVGTIEPRKNHMLILEALTKWYAESNIEFTWMVVGASGWKNDKFLNAVESSIIKDKIQLRGFVSNNDLTELYQISNVFIFASHYEGFGLPIIEAMNYHMKIYLSDIPIHREVGGESCDYFSNRDELILLLSSTRRTSLNNYANQLGRLSTNEFIVPYLREG